VQVREVSLRVSLPNSVHLLAADASETPLSDGSVDCVLTKFLLDVVSDPRAIAHEVDRLLSSRGVWINYGPSGPFDAVWRFDDNELSSFLRHSGFSVVEMDHHRTVHFDNRHLDPDAPFESHVCYLSVATKKAGLRLRNPTSSIAKQSTRSRRSRSVTFRG
jgi:hypothetical protein